MNFVLTTARLILRAPVESDLAALAAAINSRRIVENTATIPWPYGPNDALYYLQRARSAGPGTLRLRIERQDRPGEIAGGIGIEASDRRQDAELGYWLAEPSWAKGFGFEAAHAVTGYAFEVIGHERLVAGYRHGNEASRRILNRLGFRHVEHRRNWARGIGTYVPVARLELSRREWLQQSQPDAP